MQHVAKIYLAQIWLSQGKVDEAENLLQGVSQSVGAQVSHERRSGTSEQVVPAAALGCRQRQLHIRAQLSLAQLQATVGRTMMTNMIMVARIGRE